MIDFLLQIKHDKGSQEGSLFIIKPKLKVYKIKCFNFEIFLWGDPIIELNENFQTYSNSIDSFIYELIQKVQGHYYYLIFDKHANSYCAGSSLFSILPLYYATQKECLYLSCSSDIISSHLSLQKRDKRFILENILFNYPLFNHSAFEEIWLLPSNNYLHCNRVELRFQKHTKVENYFNRNNNRRKKELDQLSDLFIERSSVYFPDSIYIHALTGGFDGRTLVSCAKYHNKEFETYSFGSAESTDTEVAKILSTHANIPFNHYLLDKNYIEKHSFNCGLEFISNSSGTAAFTRAHYLHAVKELCKKTNYLITGNFGSEIFRAAHIAGIVISPNLYRLFNAKSFNDAIDSIKTSDEYNWLNKNEFTNEWDSLAEDIKSLPVFSIDYKTLTLNQRFYITVFEEVFRKYFGAEMINQFKYLINRTPFLDFQFFSRVLQSRLAGVHSSFFEHNPLKRYKGQILYSHIIQKAYPEFSNIPMNKGYKPMDLLSYRGKFRISQAYIMKKINKQTAILIDPFAVKASFLYNKEVLEKKVLCSQLFNTEVLKKSLMEGNMNNSLFVALSQAIYYNKGLNVEK